MNKIKTTVIAVISALMGWLGILAVPVFLLLGCNLMDYITGLCAAKYRKDGISSYKSIKGIAKKVFQYMLIALGAIMDVLINYAMECAGIEITVPFVVGTVVAVWLVVNEIISILENMIDIGVAMPPFLLPLVRYIRQQTENKAVILDQDGAAERERDQEKEGDHE